MSTPRNWLYKAADVRELDRRAIQDHGIDGFILMQRAAQAAFDAMQARWPQASRLHVLCGPGNNGGDGLLLAKLALEAGLQVRLELLVAEAALQGDAASALEAFRQAGGRVQAASDAAIEADVIVDALLGTGAARPLEGVFLNAVQRMNNAPPPVLSVDLPTGLAADTGAVANEAVQADITVSFIGQKLGCFTGRGPAFCGLKVFNDLAVPAEIYEGIMPAAEIIRDDLRRTLLPPRPRDAHKNRHGHVLCIGGDYGTSGAIRLAAEGALRCGAGLVTVATGTDVAVAMSQACPELMCRPVEKPGDLTELMKVANAVLIGPGLGQGAWGQPLLSLVLESGLPLVVDADALNLLAHGPASRRGNWILTPHPGEAARLLGTDKVAVQSDRLAAVQTLAERYAAVALLKGTGSLVTSAGEPVWLCDRGNPGMAVGGMGDLLAGILVSLIAQGLPLPEATRLAVFMHASAGDQVAGVGERGMLPSDLLPVLRQLVNP